MLIVLLALAASLTVTAKGETDTYEPLVGLSSPEKYYGVYITPNGEMRADTIRIPIVNSQWQNEIVASHLFYNVTLSQYALINEAQLSLWFELDTLNATEDLMISVYGADTAFSMGATLEGIDRGHPTTYNFVNVNLTGITSNQWLNITVTDIVQEVVNKWGWSSGSSLGFIIYGTPSDTARSYQSNVGVKYPRLYVTHDESEQPSEEFIEQYRGYEIYNVSTAGKSEAIAYMRDENNTREFWVLDGSGGTPDRYTSSYNFSIWEQGNCFESVGSDQFMLADFLNDTTNLFWFRSNDYFQNITEKILIYDSELTVNYFTMNYDINHTAFHIWYDWGADLHYTNVTWNGYNWTKGIDMLAHDTNYMNQMSSHYDKTTGYVYCAFDRGNYGRVTRAMTPVTDASVFNTTENYGSYADGTPYVDTYEGEVFVTMDYVSNNRVFLYKYNQSKAWDDPAGSLEFWAGMNQYDHNHGGMITDVEYDGIRFVCIGDDLNDGYRVPVIVFFDLENQTNFYNRRMNTSAAYQLSTDWVNFYADKNNKMHMVGFISNFATFDFPETIIYEGAKRSTPYEPSWSNYGLIGYAPEWKPLNIQNDAAAVEGVKALRVYKNGTIVNTTCIQAATTIEEIEACIDALEGGGQIDDPNPSGSNWGLNYWFSRAKIRLYFFVGGLSFIFLPLWVYVNMTGYDKIRFVWLILLSWVIAASLLLSIRGI